MPDENPQEITICLGKAEECFEGTRILKTKHGKEDIWVVMLVIK